MITPRLRPPSVPFFCLTSALAALLLAGCGGGGAPTTTTPDPIPDPVPLTTDQRLQQALADHGMTPLTPPPAQNADQVELGRMLFFDKALSSSFDISCSGCHHPTLQTHDGIPLSKGLGGDGLGPTRELHPGREMVARNATDLWNRGMPEFRTLLWDARVETRPDGRLMSPVGTALPEGLSGPLAAQSLLAMIDNREMHDDFMIGLGNGFMPPGGGKGGEAADPETIWTSRVMTLKFFDGYQQLFAKAYPDIPQNNFGIAEVANALAAFQTEAFVSLDSPFDRYLRGESGALTEAEKRGALLFYKEAQCASCHSGNLLTDQNMHNLLVPELGPGKAETPGLDQGRSDITGNPTDRYKFRTPPLRNVALSGPYMHNGAFATLDAVIRHHLDPLDSFREYDRAQLPDDLRSTVKDHDSNLAQQTATADQLILNMPTLTDAQIADLVSFLGALTDPTVPDRLEGLEPDIVPSNLGVDYDPGGGGGSTPGEPGEDPTPLL